MKMERPGKILTRLYKSGIFLGHMAIYPQTDIPFQFGEELKISYLSAGSDRCRPLVILHTITSHGFLLKMEPAEESASSDRIALEELHMQSLMESKTAIVPLEGGNELHLLGLNSGKERWPCFWGFVTTSGLYKSCSVMLNLRCLAMVFDLDDTLIVANTMRTFDDRIDALDRKIRIEADPLRVTGITAEMKRYQDDKLMLKQFIDHDKVWDVSANMFLNASSERIPFVGEGGIPFTRPIIRLQNQNIVLTRINPNVRDTSVLVRLRPAWEEFRSYLTAKGRKRFDVYVCTMSERDYALEMWRLLDPEQQLIIANELHERIVCVKSDSKKSLDNVFRGGRSHAKMAMVIDDRLKVWEDKDQPHVHVVPAFVPYYAPQAEKNCPLPILYVARNVACDVRASFFRDFDEGYSKRMAEVVFETDVSALPQAPDVSNYLMSEGEVGPPVEMVDGVKDFPNGMADAEVEERLKLQVPRTSAGTSLEMVDAKQSFPQPFQQRLLPACSSVQSQPSFIETTTGAKKEFDKNFSIVKPFKVGPQTYLGEPSVQGLAPREDGEVPESELDPDTRRRLLILQHGQDTSHSRNMFESSMEPQFPVKTPLNVSMPSAAPPGGWLGAEEEINPHQVSRFSEGNVLPESLFLGKAQSYGPSGFAGIKEEPFMGEERSRRSDSVLSERTYPGGDSSLKSVSNLREFQPQSISPGISAASNSVTVLQQIAQKCNTKVSFVPVVNVTKELQFVVEVLFGGEKVGQGTGRTKKEAQHIAAENALRFMASQFISQPAGPVGLAQGAVGSSFASDEHRQSWNVRDPRFAAGFGPVPMNETLPFASAPGQPKPLEARLVEETKELNNAVSSLKDWCTMQGMNVVFKEPGGVVQGREFQAQVEVAGRIMGRGSGPNWEAAKQQAAEEALNQLNVTSQSRAFQNRMNTPRSPPPQSGKRVRSGQHLPASPGRLSPKRYSKSGPSVL